MTALMINPAGRPGLRCAAMCVVALVFLIVDATVSPAAASDKDGGARFRAAEPWAEPIRDYLARGERSFPDGFNRAITALTVFEGRLWLGYGDATRNLGTPAPVEFRYFSRPEDPQAVAARVLAEGQGAPQRSPTDTGEEQIEPYRICLGRLWQAGVDSNDPDESWTQAKPGPVRLIEGNVFRHEEKNGEPVWRKFRSIPGGEHVHDIAQFDGALYVVGSGSDNRVEWEGGRIFRYLWKSVDEGVTFSTVHREMYPEPGKGDTRFLRLLPAGHALYAFGYVNPFVDGGPLEGRHVALRAGNIQQQTADTFGELAGLVVIRTWSLDAATGLAVARGEGRESRVFLVEEKAARELESWADLRIIDMTPDSRSEGWFVLAGHGENPETFAVHRTMRKTIDQLSPVLSLGKQPSTSITLWNGDLYIGTAEGRILRARGTRSDQGNIKTTKKAVLL